MGRNSSSQHYQIYKQMDRHYPVGKQLSRIMCTSSDLALTSRIKPSGAQE